MSQGLRVTLPGYDAETDTNPDHFALKADEDWILIKERTRGILTVPTGTSPTVRHGLGYVPLVFAWALIGSKRIFLSGGDLTGTYNIKLTVGVNDFTIINGTGSTAIINYFVFYDSQISGQQPSIPLPPYEIGVTKFGFNAETETNPNNYIMRSDLNTFKILYTDKASFVVTASSTQTKSIPQKVWFNKIPAVTAFCQKNGSAKVIGPSQFQLGVTTDNYKFFHCWADNNNIFFELRNDGASDITVNIKYYLFEV